MKKYLIFLVIFFSIFIFSDKVFALSFYEIPEDKIVSYNLRDKTNDEVYQYFKDVFINTDKSVTDKLAEHYLQMKDIALNEISTGNYNEYAIFVNTNDSYYSLSKNTGIIFRIILYKNDSDFLNNSISIKFRKYSPNSGYNGTDGTIAGLISSLDFKVILHSGSVSNNFGERNIWYHDTFPDRDYNGVNYKTPLFATTNSFSTNGTNVCKILYDSILPIKILNKIGYESEDFYDGISIVKDNVNVDYTVGDELISSSGTPTWIKNTYTYENNINCKGISKIRINFKPTDEDLNLKFESIFAEHLLGFPKLEYQGDTTFSYNFSDYIGDKIKLGAVDDYNNELYSYNGVYEGMFGPSSLDNFNNIQVEIDVSSYGAYDYYLKFESNLEYEIELVNIIDEIDYWKTINMNNNYSIYLIPKNLNRDIYSNITMNGNYDITIKESYSGNNTGKTIKELKNYDNNNFQYLFTHADLGTIICFKNNRYKKENGSGDYITFDTRYYSYAIQTEEYESPIIYNPNINQEYNVNWKDFEEKVSMNSFLDSISQMFNGDSIKNIFAQIYNLFRNSKIGLYMFVVIITSIIIGVIKSMK